MVIKTKSNAFPPISGFISKAKLTASNSVFSGRFVCSNVQWTDESENSWLTFTITAEELFSAVESNLIWTDQDVQRGIKPDFIGTPPKEVSLANGYPDKNIYIFDENNADDMVMKLLNGERLFLNPLVWNMRPGTFECYYNKSNQSVYIYSGKIYLPDSHHRQQAIVKAVRLWKESPESYPCFDGNRQFKIELYFLSKEDEGNYFYDKNQRTKPVSLSKSYDLSTIDDLSLLSKAVIEKTPSLIGNVNRVTDRLSSKVKDIITLSTLHEMMRLFAGEELYDKAEMEGLSNVASDFLKLLSITRQELNPVDISSRIIIRNSLIVDSAVMMYGYVALMKRYKNDLGKFGKKEADKIWTTKLQQLSSTKIYSMDDWSGDIFDKQNPLWIKIGIMKRGGKNNSLTTLNTGASRIKAGKALNIICDDIPMNGNLSGIEVKINAQ